MALDHKMMIHRIIYAGTMMKILTMTMMFDSKMLTILISAMTDAHQSSEG